ncbi:MAG: hypothetical protein FJ267_16795, partial [Planctomycetes bacterium]|nr:hypothetical protein [Planctomycetota bacterium]
MQSCLDLMHVAGYENREQDFESLIRILDSELRLITPIDLDGLIAEGNLSRPGEGNNGSERFYHLTHDYLVPSIQEWLTRKQRETRKGRAELLLSERSGLWKHRTSHQNLLSIFELMNVAWYVPRVFRRIDDEQALFKASVKFQGTRILFVMAVVGVITFAISEQTKRFQMTELIDSLVNASTSDVPRIVERMEPFRSRAAPRLNQLLKTSEPDSLMHHHVAMALLPSDLTQVPGVVEHLLTSNATDFVALNQLMERYRVKDSVKQQLWKELTDHDR